MLLENILGKRDRVNVYIEQLICIYNNCIKNYVYKIFMNYMSFKVYQEYINLCCISFIF